MRKVDQFIKIAYGSVPKDGGTYTFYRNLRPELLRHGIDLRCVSTGREQALLWEDVYADDGCVLLEPDAKRVKKQSRSFAYWCEEEGMDIVIAVNSKAILSAIDHLPESIRIVSRCANAFDHGYKITMSGRERLAAIIATTPRLRKDLIEKYGARDDLVELIPNGIASQPFTNASHRPRGGDDELKLGFLGRLEHNQKGVLHIPKIVAELNRRGLKFRLRIAGKGRDRAIIERDLGSEISSGQVEFLGAIPPAEVPDFLGSNDVFLFTSHFEGCPNALLESLMSGCVPVSWRIDGITDYIIRHGESGFLSEPGDYQSMGAQIEHLANNRLQLRSCSAMAAEDARARFDSIIAARAYAAVFVDVLSRPPPPWQPKDWKDFRVDENFSNSLTNRITSGLRRRLHNTITRRNSPDSSL